MWAIGRRKFISLNTYLINKKIQKNGINNLICINDSITGFFHDFFHSFCCYCFKLLKSNR